MLPWIGGTSNIAMGAWNERPREWQARTHRSDVRTEKAAIRSASSFERMNPRRWRSRVTIRWSGDAMCLCRILTVILFLCSLERPCPLKNQKSLEWWERISLAFRRAPSQRTAACAHGPAQSGYYAFIS